MENEKQILEKFVRFTDKDTKETRLIIKNLAKELDIYDGNPKRRGKIMLMIEGLEDSITDNQSCMDYLSKRLVEIDQPKTCQHHFPVAWSGYGKNKNVYYNNCEFCGCEPLSTLRDLNK